jgi:hypothetical protein
MRGGVMAFKRFLLFTYSTYYPGGGWCDFRGSFDTIDEAAAAGRARETERDFIEVVDLETGDTHTFD